MYGLEHPDITSARRTGYPTWYEEGGEIPCDVCGGDITNEEEYVHIVNRKYNIKICKCCIDQYTTFND